MNFVEEAIKLSEPLVDKLKKHPFNIELGLGTLSKEKFVYYIEQDSHYVNLFSKVLEILADRTSEKNEKKILIELASDAMDIERNLHEVYFEKFKANKNSEIMPTCEAYGNFLASTASIKSYPEGLAALLPCFISYGEVGKSILTNTIDNNPYEEWIKTYSNESYDYYVRQLITAANSAAERVDEVIYKSMLALYIKSNMYEYMFWDAAYRMESWYK